MKTNFNTLLYEHKMFSKNFLSNTLGFIEIQNKNQIQYCKYINN